MELAIDTSAAMAGVCLADQGKLQVEFTWRAEFSHTVQLLPAIEHVLRHQGLRARDISLIVIARGPGSYSGLRVGVSAAKGLALALDVPLVGIDTFAVEAYPWLGLGKAVQPIMDSGRGQIATCRFPADMIEQVGPPPAILTTIQELCASITEPTLFCGEHLPGVRREISERSGALAFLPPDSAVIRRPGNLAELGWRRYSRGERDDAATLQPVYLRAPSITRPRPAQSLRR